MKLSELVGFKNELDKMSILPSQQATNTEVNKINYLIYNFNNWYKNIFKKNWNKIL